MQEPTNVINILVPMNFLPTRSSPHVPLTHIYMSHISHFVEEAYNIEGTVQQEKEHKFQGESRALGTV